MCVPSVLSYLAYSPTSTYYDLKIYHKPAYCMENYDLLLDKKIQNYSDHGSQVILLCKVFVTRVTNILLPRVYILFVYL